MVATTTTESLTLILNLILSPSFENPEISTIHFQTSSFRAICFEWPKRTFNCYLLCWAGYISCGQT